MKRRVIPSLSAQLDQSEPKFIWLKAGSHWTDFAIAMPCLAFDCVRLVPFRSVFFCQNLSSVNQP